MATESDQSIVIGVVTISDRAFSGEYTDRGGPAIQTYIKSRFVGPPETKSIIIPDDQLKIESTLQELSKDCGLILTTGGTGPAPRDVTPEATLAVCKKELVGFGERMRSANVEKVPTTILSRATAGICGTAVIINLPGSPKAVAECMDAVIKAVPHAVRLAGGGKLRLVEGDAECGRSRTEKQEHVHTVGENGGCEGCGVKH